MDKQREKAFNAWSKFLNPEVLRGNLIAASIFLAAYETLRSSVIDKIRSFFTHGYENRRPILSPDYQKEVLALDKSPFRASLLWLKDMSAIDDKDMERVDEIRQHRNELAHELLKFIATADANINIQLLGSIHDLVTKIDRWWIREVEIPCNSDFDGKEISDSDIVSGNMIFLYLMMEVAEGKDSSVFWEAFQREAAKEFRKG